jgi:SAM-dependent methyltransferase
VVGRMSDPWATLAQAHGRRAVMSLGISDAELDAETIRQIAVLRPLIAGVLNGSETRVLDYGCGAGRFTAMLGETVGWCAIGYDPASAAKPVGGVRNR